MPNDVKVDVVVPAAGIGSRMGADRPKQYLLLDDSITILEATIASLLCCKHISNIIVAISSDDLYFKNLPCAKDPRIISVLGGAERSDTVYLALKAVKTRYVMVHDAARPFVKVEDLEKLLSLCDSNVCGGILASPVADTIKKSSLDFIENTVDRKFLYRAFTPQLFATDLLLKALDYCQQQQLTVTDEASAVEALGLKPKLINSSTENFKITTPADLVLARALYRYHKEKNAYRLRF